MNFLKKILGKKDAPIQSYSDFWNWFQKHQEDFFKVVKGHHNVEENFFDKISPKLNELRDGYFYLTGMCAEDTAELVITADGNINNIVFAEELVQAAPAIKGWRFTALKQPMNIDSVEIEMNGDIFSSANLHFYSTDYTDYPDEIDITVIHDDFTEQNKSNITSGTYIFLDNYLGELNFATTIDSLKVAGKSDAKKELIPISKLKDFLIWREKEFIEKYEGVRHNTENDQYSGLEAELKSGKPLVAVINTELLGWDSKASHPWIAILKIKYKGDPNSGMPDPETYALLDDIENRIMEELHDVEGYLNIGRETVDSVREIYFACKDFRKPSKVFDEIQNTHSHLFEIKFDIYKDKYWQSFKRFEVN